MLNFDKFISRLQIALNSDLPGADAQHIMAPGSKGLRETMLSQNPDPRRGGVMALFYPVNNAPFLVLIKRPDYDGHHSGQVSFPGGKPEPADHDLLDTALRETEEEVGIKSQEIEIIGGLSKLYIPPSKYLVSPFVGKMDYRPEFIPDDIEVQEILEVSLAHLLNEETIKSREMRMADNRILITPYFDIQGYVVWGATAMILSELLYIIRKLD